MSATLTIGDYNRAGTLQITDTRWDALSETMFVTVRELFGGRAGWDLAYAKQDRAVRDLARRAIDHPELTRSARITFRWFGMSCDHWTVAVSRVAS